MNRCIDDEDKGWAEVPTPGGKQRVLVINESGVYAATFKSRKPSAKAFRRWVTSEVLPSIRRVGSYNSQATRAKTLPEMLTPEDLSDLLDRPMQITVREYLALTQGASQPAAIAHTNGQHYSEDVRARVLDLGDKGWMPAEIAERMGLPKATICTMLFRARKAGKIARGPRQGTLAREAKKGGEA